MSVSAYRPTCASTHHIESQAIRLDESHHAVASFQWARHSGGPDESASESRMSASAASAARDGSERALPTVVIEGVPELVAALRAA